ncbi:PASTA domain-containing protein, partial [Nonomuraea rhizosphaerae]|uniref:PASTA domain-containing protein n=1 Tax=Nonomuraea rhizosphaerae TaxID=2665663 RepID=UPI001C5DCF0E
HGLSTGDVPWTPPGGVSRPVPMCAADAARLADGLEPVIRKVVTANGEERPHWEAGTSYRPWASPYFENKLIDLALVPETMFWPQPARVTTVPDLTDMPINQARIRALRAQVRLDLQRMDPDPPPTEGVVVQQQPAPGARVLRNTTVTVWLRFPLPYPTWRRQH